MTARPRVLLIGVETDISVDAFKRLREVLEADFPDHTVRIVAGLRYAAEIGSAPSTRSAQVVHADGAYL